MAKATDQSKTGYVTIATVRRRAEASQIVDKLESASIESVVTVERGSELASAKYRWFYGVKVQVSRSNVSRALQVLQLSRTEKEQSAPRQRKSEITTGLSRFHLSLDSWQEAAIAIGVIIAVAALLALWLF